MFKHYHWTIWTPHWVGQALGAQEHPSYWMGARTFPIGTEVKTLYQLHGWLTWLISLLLYINIL